MARSDVRAQIPPVLFQTPREDLVKKLTLFMVIAAIAACGGTELSTNDDALDVNGGGGKPEPQMLGVHWAKGAGGGHGGKPANMTFHNGPVMTSSVTQAIFWGNWSSPGDKITGLDSWYGGFGGSNYAGTSTEY